MTSTRSTQKRRQGPGKCRARIIALVAALALAAPLALGGCTEQPEQLTWPTSGLSTVLPKPDLMYGEVNFDSDIQFGADLEPATADDYRAYRDQCKEAGFTIEPETDSTSYTAFNEDGYKLRLSFYDSFEQISIYLDAPRETKEIVWPTMGLATLLPVPTSSVGSIESDSVSQFFAYVADTPIESYEAYVEACVATGFDIDHSRGDTWYQADDAAGNSLSLSYEGFETMKVAIYAPDEEDEDAGAETVVSEGEEGGEANETSTTNGNQAEQGTDSDVTNESTQQNDPQDVAQPEEDAESTETESAEGSAPAAESAEAPAETDAAGAVEAVAGAVTDVIGGDVTPEFKATMDSYEAFFDEYVEFMNNYQDSNDVVGMLTQYSEMMTRYAETMEALGEVDTASLSAADLAYYTEVTARITQKLATIGQ